MFSGFHRPIQWRRGHGKVTDYHLSFQSSQSTKNLREDNRMASQGLSGPILTKQQVPEHFHEHFIIRGYRHPKSTPTQCILSMFDPTNETLNFWTHFLPSWYFLWILKGLSETLDFQQDNYTWPLLTYMFVCVIFPLTSATAHTFNTMSSHARHICFFLDYGSLSVFSLGVAIAYRAYVFPSALVNTWFGQNFVYIAAINSIVCVLISCQTRFMKLSILRTLMRLGAFAWPYMYDSIPVIYRLLFCDQVECQLSSQFQHGRQFIFAATAAFLYATHLPERLNPGRFDIIGHSHQLFHVASILGVLDQMQAILHDMADRRSQLIEDWGFVSLCHSVGVMSIVMLINLVIIGLYVIRLKAFIQNIKSQRYKES